MPIHIAHKTLNAIETAIAADGGAAYRVNLGKVIPHIGDAYRGAEEDGFRTHLGASVLGRECAREIWYGFRWVRKSSFGGRMLRLFNRGHLEEARFIAILLTIGVQVYQQDAEGKQFRISFAQGHAGGSGDGVLIGLPELQETPALGEFKTHGEKSFIELAGDLKAWRAHVAAPEVNRFTGKGVREAKWEHFVQMQLYMKRMGIPVALYMAVNKNTDDIYAEFVMLDHTIAEQYLNRGEKLVYMDVPPEKLNKSPGFFKCKFCDMRGICHLGETPAINCRTCDFARPNGGDSNWYCSKHNATLNKEAQKVGCAGYVRHRDL